MSFNKVTIIGVGLIGGSLGMSLCRRNLARQVIGVDFDGAGLTQALQCGAIHRAAASPAEGVKEAQLIILATPVRTSVAVAKEIMPHLAPGTVITDVGSTKAWVVKEIEKILAPGISFVGGHPMAGSERAGINGADQYLFENAFYMITPTDKTPRWALHKITAMVQGIGARVIEMSPQEHDMAVAAVSHLPHFLAAVLVNTLSAMPMGEKYLPLAAGGFRDTTRIAAGNPLMWRDIFLSNQDMVLRAIKEFRSQLDLMESAILKNDGENIILKLQQAREVRQSIPAKTKGYLPALFEITVTVPDRPGVIAEISGWLGKEGINITDIEILRVREGEGGTMRLAFAHQWEQEQALFILREKGIGVNKR